MAMSPGEKIAQEKPEIDVEGNVEAAEKPVGAGELNPVLDAFRTIATFVAAKQQQGDPNAAEMQALLAQFVALLQGKTGPASGNESMMAPPAGVKGGRIGMGKAVSPMGQAQMSAGKGRVQVI